MRRIGLILGLFVLMLIPMISACSSPEAELIEPLGGSALRGSLAEPSAIIDNEMQRSVMSLGQTQERLLIRQGQLDIVVRDTEESLSEIGRMAEEKGGWVVTSNISQSDQFKAGTITIRIPADQFNNVVNQIKQTALEIRSETTNSRDVTEEYVDNQARLENLEATAERVRGFLNQASNVEEALEVSQELSHLEGEIESLNARMEYISQSAAFASLTVNLNPDEPSQPIEIAGWRPEGVAKTAIETLISVFQRLAEVIIWGVIFCLPLAILVGIPLFLVGRYFYRRRSLRKVADEEE